MGRRLAEREEAATGAMFDAIIAIITDAWAEAYPSVPFAVGGKVTPKAMAFFEGFCAGVAWGQEEPTNGEG